MAEAGLSLRGEQFYAEHEITLVCGEWIASAALPDRASGAASDPGRATARSGRVLAFDRLALTVGGTPRRLDLPGAQLAGIHYVRDVDDATALRSDLATARRTAIVGGGFIGLEIAAAARAVGTEVTILEAADRLLGRVVAPATSEFYAAAHRARGATVELGAEVSGFAGATRSPTEGRVTGVLLADGRTIAADTVIVGVGLAPHTELAEQLGLECADTPSGPGGILVDTRARTSRPEVVAAGDCTVIALPGGERIRVESVQNAIAQAKLAAATLIGAEPPATGVPWFWSDQNDLKLQIAGLNAGYDETVVRGDRDAESFSVLYYRDDRLIAIDAVNAPRDYMAVRRILGDGGNVPQRAARDPAVALKDFVTRSA